MNSTIKKIRKELQENAEIDYRKSSKNFFKEPIKIYGTKTPVVRRIADKYYKEIDHLTKEQIYELAEELYKSNYNEESIVASQWVMKLQPKYEASDFKTFEKWIDEYLNNWSKVDDFCTHAMHQLLIKFPHTNKKIEIWTKSENKWLRRASAVTYVSWGKKDKACKFYEKFLPDVFKTAESLLTDEEDLVQKGYGWMLKYTAICYPNQVYQFLAKHKNNMTRIALRYAIEKMPQEMRAEIMQK